MKGMNQLQPATYAQPQQKKGFSSIITMPSNKTMIERCVGDPARAASLISTLISVVNSTPALQECRPETIISAALRGEIGMGLSLALGEYGIIPYKDIATFQLQVKGLERLAIRSGCYSDINFFDVREGEYAGRDERTREPRFKWNEDEDEREKLPIVGYYGFYILNEKNNRFFRCIYWTHQQILKHADRYSKAFSLKKYNAMLNGDLSPDEVRRLQFGSPWYGMPDDMAHQKMCIKTIAKQLLGDGLAPKEIIQAIAADNAQETSDEPVVYGDTFDAVAAEAASAETMPEMPKTATVDASAEETAKTTAKSGAETAQKTQKVKSPAKTAKSAPAQENPPQDALSSFFDE